MSIGYEAARDLANRIRSQFGFPGVRILKSDIRRIYRELGIRVHYRDDKVKHLRGAYFAPPLGPSVMIARSLPEEPQIFTLAHELKHHLVDQTRALSFCDISNQDDLIEKTAEVFAAELIFPQALFVTFMRDAGISPGGCSADDLVHLKMRSKTTMSYQALCKMTEFLGYCEKGAFQKVKFKVRQEQLYGEPLYKRLRRAELK